MNAIAVGWLNPLATSLTLSRGSVTVCAAAMETKEKPTPRPIPIAV